MPDFHHNIFYYYRGASLSESARERQLEDNTTKALINVIEHCDLKVSSEFLQWLGIKTSEKPICELQRATIGSGSITQKSKRILLAIVPSQETLASRDISSDHTKSRPDAWIYGQDYVILIESKIVGKLDNHQLNRHKSLLISNDEPVVKTWAEIHNFFKYLIVDPSTKDAWLIQQFTRYLENNGMGGFTGFDAEIFDYFINQGDVDTKRWFREYMNIFAETLSIQLKHIDAFYEHYDVGNIKANSMNCWIAFGPSGDRYRKFAHQSVSIDPMGIKVFLNVETQPAVTRLKSCIINKNESFRSTVINLGCLDISSIEIIERSQIRASLYDYMPVVQIEGRILKDTVIGKTSFDYFESVIKRIKFPEFIIKVVLPRKDVISQREDILQEIMNIAEDLNPLVALINQ